MRRPSIVVVDYGVGNSHSVASAFHALDCRRIKISNLERDIAAADALILPGVGAFQSCMKSIRKHNLDKILSEYVLEKNKPILGICVGMQLMANISEEDGVHEGLGWIPGRVIKLSPPQDYMVPHVGWNDVRVIKGNTLFSWVDTDPHFYFDHIYHYQCDQKFIVAECKYGQLVSASIAY
jgi:glutamine amidotransferase